MTIETQEDVDALKRIGRIVSLTLQHMLDSAKPGMRTRELDQIGAAMLQAHGARSAPQLTYDFPGATCISINEEAAHGIPGDRIIGAGDVLNVDVSAELGGYFADTGGTVVVPPGTAQKTRLCHATRMALAAAMKNARAGQPINGIGAAKLGLQHLATAAAINLVRVWTWLEGDRPKGTKRSAFLRLMVPIPA